MSSEDTLHIKVTEPQAEFHALTCRYPLFIGGYGSGKTEAMLNQAIMDASHSPDALIALYAPTYKLIRLNIWPRLLEKLTLMGLGPLPNKLEGMIRTEHPQFGSFVVITLDNPANIISYETFAAHIDELDTLPFIKAKEVWEKVIGRNRQALAGRPELENKVSVYTSPEGFNFTHKYWSEQENNDYQYITVSTRSNPFLPEGYVQNLIDTYPPQLVEAYVNGGWVNLVSGTVYANYDRDTHDSEEIVTGNETLYIGCDFNVTKQAATIYVRRDGGKQWHAVDELVDMYDTPDMITKINNRYPGHPIVIYPDASGKARKTVNASTSDIALLEQAGYKIRANKSNPLIKDRVLAVNAALNKGLIFINTHKCPTVADCLEQQVYDVNGQPDKKSGNDHQNDATTYPIAYEMPISKPVAQIDFSFTI